MHPNYSTSTLMTLCFTARVTARVATQARAWACAISARASRGDLTD
jgi:hypothetical protein